MPTAETDQVVQFWRTNDMAFATYLKLEGFSSQNVSWQYGTCYWVFRVTDGLLDVVRKFEEGQALVEPREYSKAFSLTKKEFYNSKPDATHAR